MRLTPASSPTPPLVIFDEAHELEDIASQYFGVALSNARFDELARDTENMLRAKQVSTSAIESATASLRERSRLFFASLPVGPSHLGRLEFTGRADFLEARGDAYLATSNALVRLEGELDRLQGSRRSPRPCASAPPTSATTSSS